jgi:lipopolysaccharide transport system permease protein
MLNESIMNNPVPKPFKSRVYEPDNVLKQGYFHIFKDILAEIPANRWLTFQLFKRDLFAVYKQSFVGVFWALIMPLISVGTFVLLNRSGILDIGDIDAPYAVYAILGMAFWQLFSTGLIAGSNSLVKAGAMIVKINFSRKSLVIASLGQSLVSCFIQLLLVSVLFFVYDYSPTWYVFLLPVLVLPVIFLAAGLGFILSILNGIMRDIGNALSIMLTFFMFLTPVLYARPRTGIMAEISRYNIMYYLVDFPRELILAGQAPELTGYLVSCGIAAAVLVVCVFVFHLAETRVTERI